jgi:hypothetical protein
MRKQLALIAAAAALLGAASSAQAYAVLTIVDSGVAGSARTCDLTLWDGSANYCDSVHVGFNIVSANNVSFSGTIGNHSVSTTSGTGNSPGNSVFGILDTSTTSVTRNSAIGGGNLQINMTGFGYTSPTGLVKTFEGSASYTSSLFALGDSVRSDFWVDPNGAGANVNNLNCTVNVGVTAFGCSAGSLVWNDNGGSFSIRSLQTYNVAVNGSVNVTSTGIVKNKLPEPATLSLVGLALVGAGFAGRRAAKKA